ncbi:DUF732 domain-containing protein [Symbioplanes lichenis]|uniref:DUF732 domain-containing protein n=1 Tax=Symbioplanes lichenis TaxID=1629072 RepID=UPI0027392497|nr:DUF732 domain-containing protein [Actinoplanes lichenis]
MTKRWLVATALITTLAGCAEPAPSPMSAGAPVTAGPQTGAPGSADAQAGAPAAGEPAAPGSAAGDPAGGAPALESTGDLDARPGKHAQQARAAAAGTPAFVAAVQREFPALAVDRRDDELAALADQTCADLTAGRDSATVLAQVRTLDPGAVDDRTARRLVHLAVDTVCPDQDRRIDEF